MTTATHVAPAPRPAGAVATAARRMMGGHVSVEIGDVHEALGSARVADRVLDRLEAWAGRLTRFDARSELCRLNDTPGDAVRIGPTLAAVLDWSRIAEALTDGLVDVAMLDERLAAEHGTGDAHGTTRLAGARRRWSLTRLARGAIVHRAPTVRFDLDGVAKGWLADRALAVAPGGTSMVDGDGDIAIRLAPGAARAFAIADPRDAGAQLTAITLQAPDDRPASWGLATSGTSVHRWTHGFGATHHLIDSRTHRPAVTDVVQATVLAATARAAEAFAKVAVVVGADAAFDRLDRPDVHGLLLLTDAGEIRASEGMVRWLA